MLTVERVGDLAGFRALEPVWNEALARSGHDLVFLAFEFLEAEWSHLGWDGHGAAPEPFALVVKDAGRVEALLPLARASSRLAGLPVTCLRAFGTLSMRRDFILPVEPVGALDAALAHLIDHERGWTVLDLAPVARTSPLLAALGTVVARRGLRLHAVDNFAAPYITVADDFSGYL